MNSVITGVGCYLPERVLTNFDLEKMIDTSDEWITVRTGIKERHIVEENQRTSDLATNAAKEAIIDAKIDPLELDLIITATVTSDMLTPSISCVVQKNIGATNAAAFDVNAACAGFVYALNIAEQFIKTGTHKNILVIGVDALSRITDWEDRKSCILFGDGAGAVILSQTEENIGILARTIGADGRLGNNLTAPNLIIEEEEINRRIGANKRTIWMDGSEVFKFAVRIMADSTNKLLDELGLTIDDVDVIVPHQANIRIIEGAVKRLKIDGNKVFTNIEHCGNMSSASIPVALCGAVKSGAIKSGNNVVLVGFGGGLTWSAVLMKWR